jgi:sucrose-phosphate synthase
MSARQKEQEQVRLEATEDLAEDLSESEKGDTIGELAPLETPKKKFERNFSDLTVWSDENKEKKLSIVLIRSVDLVTFGHQY